MDSDQYLDVIAREGAATTAAAAKVGIAADVPSCPDWDVADLLAHTGRVHRWVTEIVTTRAQERVSRVGILAPTDDDLLPWFDEGVRELVEALRATDPAERVWTWSTEQSAGFWRRRMAVETTVHRWDAESATGTPGAIDADVAADAIDEFLDVYLPSEEAPLPPGGGSIHLHRTDVDGEWGLTLEADAVRVERGHAHADVAVRGSAQDLLLLLWRRIPPDQLEVLGDRSVLDRFLGWMEL